MSTLPDGLIFEFAVDRKGLNIDVARRDLVRCKNCKYAQPCLNWKGDVNPDKVSCDHNRRMTYKLNDFCSYGERKED